MGLNTAQILFGGALLLAMLFACYGLYEWGRYVLGCLCRGWSERRAQLAFGLPATLVAFLPCGMVAGALRLQPFGGERVFDASQVGIVFIVTGTLVAGMAIELVALVAFAVQAGRVRR